MVLSWSILTFKRNVIETPKVTTSISFNISAVFQSAYLV